MKLTVAANAADLPLTIYIESASPHEITLVQISLDGNLIDEQTERLLSDKAYDSDLLEAELTG